MFFYKQLSPNQHVCTSLSLLTLIMIWAFSQKPYYGIFHNFHFPICIYYLTSHTYNNLLHAFLLTTPP